MFIVYLLIIVYVSKVMSPDTSTVHVISAQKIRFIADRCTQGICDKWHTSFDVILFALISEGKNEVSRISHLSRTLSFDLVIQ